MHASNVYNRKLSQYYRTEVPLCCCVSFVILVVAQGLRAL